jgi:hypothetical protein
MSQTESRTAAAANRLIALLMKTILRGSPGVSRVRLAVVHNGIDDLSPTGNLRYDVTNSVPARGRPIGRMARNQKLSDWDAFLPALLAGQCALHRTTGSAPFGLTLPGTTNLLICPVHDLVGDLAGAVVIMWDGCDQPPERRALRSLMEAGKQVAAQIAAVLCLCGPDALLLPGDSIEVPDDSRECLVEPDSRALDVSFSATVR